MRVKIKGEITLDRLEKALTCALDKLEEARPGCKIYGANLYLNSFDTDGLPFDLIDHFGNQLIITINADSGELVRPALTADGEKKRLEIKEREAAEKAQKEAIWREENEKWLLRQQKIQQQAALAKEHFDILNSITKTLVEKIPDRFVDELNNIIRSVWSEVNPIETSGSKKGQLKPQPVFSVNSECLFLLVDTWKKPKRMINPVCTLTYGKLRPIWTHDAWDKVMERIVTQMEILLDEIEEE